MRITQNMLHTGALSQYRQNLRQVAVAQQRVSSGLRIQKASDDPAAASGTMDASTSLRALDQYRRNIQSTRTRADAEERVMDQLGDVLTRARELALSQASSSADEATRKTAQIEVRQLLGFVVGLANTRIGSDFLFGGSHAGQAPVTWDDPAAPPTINLDELNPGHHRAEISSGQYVQTSNNARDVFGESGILEDLFALSEALGNNDPAETKVVSERLASGFDHVQAVIGEIGARATQLQVTAANLDALEITLRTFKSDLQEVDLEKAVTELMSRQAAFDAALLATSRVLGKTLADYIR